jgi:hypothetical protein
MAPNQVRLVQNDYAAGAIRDVARHLIPEQGVYDLRNYLLDEDGMPYKRGGTVEKSNAAFGTALHFLWDGYLAAGQRTLFANSSDFGVLANDDETPINLGSDGMATPKVATEIAGMVFIGGGYIYAGSKKALGYLPTNVGVTNGSQTVTLPGGNFATRVDPGMLFQRGATERVYVVESVQSDTSLTLSEPYEGTTGSGLTVAFVAIYKMTTSDPYRIADFYAVCANRLIVASYNLIEVSEINKPHDWTATIGGQQIPTQHELPEGVYIIGLGVIGQLLQVYATGGTWTISGLAFDIVDSDGNPLQQLSLLSRDFVALNSEGVATWNQSLIVPASDGIYLMDGVSAPKKISRSIERLYREYVRLGYRAGQAREHQGHYFLPIITTAGAPKDVLVCRLDRPITVRGESIYPWSRLSGQGGEIVAFAQRVGLSTRTPVLLGADSRSSARVLDCQNFFAPAGQYALDADDTAFESDVITRDFETGDMTENMVRWLRVNHQLIDAGTDDPQIEASYASDLGDPDAAYWGHPDGEWGAGFGPEKNGSLQPWTDAVESTFRSIGTIPEDRDGTHPIRLRVNKKARYIRFRLRSGDPCAVHRLRSTEIAVRPSGAVRR